MNKKTIQKYLETISDRLNVHNTAIFKLHIFAFLIFQTPKTILTNL